MIDEMIKYSHGVKSRRKKNSRLLGSSYKSSSGRSRRIGAVAKRSARMRDAARNGEEEANGVEGNGREQCVRYLTSPFLCP